jgi:predicted signal transduction protein with EAL and GGDEF domain
VLRASDTVARLGGDEFAVLLPGDGAAGAGVTAQRLLDALERPMVIDGYGMNVGASIGISVYPEHGLDAQALLRRADVAMYVAKRGRRGSAIYTPEQDQHSLSRLALMGEMRSAIEQNQLVLHYQPIVSFATGIPDRVEALVRWQHPWRGLIAPDEFIPLAEQTGLINQLTRWVLATALQQCARWRAAGRRLGVAVNLSTRTLHDRQLPETVAALLVQHGLSASDLTLEITESALMPSPQRALDILVRLHDMGVRLAIDDFGTGYSSLSYLKQLPVSEIKIDKSFVLDMLVDPNDAAIVRATIDLAHTLGLRTIAEGIEDATTWERLCALGCDAGQGYYLAHPLPDSALEEWLSTSAVEVER